MAQPLLFQRVHNASCPPRRQSSGQPRKAMEPIYPGEKKKRRAEDCRRIEEEMSTIALAERGGIEIQARLGRNRKTANKRVLLGTDAAEMDQRFVEYALQLCARLGAGLEIVHLVKAASTLETDKSEGGGLQRRMEKKNITYQAIVPAGSFEEEVEKYARGRRDILCVVLASVPKKERGERWLDSGRKENKLLKNFSCPVVLFE